MSNPISGITSGGADYGVTSTASRGGEGNGSGDFVKSLQDAMSEVGDLQSQADTRVNQLLTGNGQDVHSAMIAVEKASLAFDMMVQVRNKIVQAYQQVSGMQF
ncbi:MAG TPA: flagellar hook-basal body complex protein FliE [Candidatus Acidoferrum sp.]|nr:flagellar hook-basal body complex protein FliE [Candidatus Acidoferrum sp.]